jgi:hypothetical protein
MLMHGAQPKLILIDFILILFLNLISLIILVLSLFVVTQEALLRCSRKTLWEMLNLINNMELRLFLSSLIDILDHLGGEA